MGVKCFRGIDQTFRPYIWQTDYVSECSIFRKLGINTMVEQSCRAITYTGLKKERENSTKVSKCIYPQIVGYWRLVGDQGIQPFCSPARYDHSSALSVFHVHINQPFDFS